MNNPSGVRFVKMKRRGSSENLAHIPYILAVTVTLFIIWLVPMYQAVTESPWSQSSPVIVQTPHKEIKPSVEAPVAPRKAVIDPCTLKDVICGKVVRATVTNYQAVSWQTDASPCQGAMPKIDFCNPPFPIVAANSLPLGTKVKIRGTIYTVADRTSKKYSDRFDILTDTVQPTMHNEPIEIL